MNEALFVGRNVQDKVRATPYRLIINLHQMIQALHLVILRSVVEPAWTDAHIHFSRMPHRFALDVSHSPVGFLHPTTLVATPSRIRSIPPDDAVRLQFADECRGVSPIVIARLNLTLLAQATIVTVPTVCSIFPNLEDRAILGKQLAQLTSVIVDVIRRAITQIMTVPR